MTEFLENWRKKHQGKSVINPLLNHNDSEADRQKTNLPDLDSLQSGYADLSNLQITGLWLSRWSSGRLVLLYGLLFVLIFFARSWYSTAPELGGDAARKWETARLIAETGEFSALTSDRHHSARWFKIPYFNRILATIFSLYFGYLLLTRKLFSMDSISMGMFLLAASYAAVLTFVPLKTDPLLSIQPLNGKYLTTMMPFTVFCCIYVLDQGIRKLGRMRKTILYWLKHYMLLGNPNRQIMVSKEKKNIILHLDNYELDALQGYIPPAELMKILAMPMCESKKDA